MNRTLAISEKQGLSQIQAKALLDQDGPNELTPVRKRTYWRIVLEVVREPMLQLLVAAGVIYMIIGNAAESFMLLAFVVLTACITIIQERRTETVLRSLRGLTSPQAQVIRSGVLTTISALTVVCGDLIVIEEGDLIPADAVLIQAHDVLLDESMLTGESVPVSKVPSSLAISSPITRLGGDTSSWIYAATTVLSGTGIAQVLAIGASTEIGRVGKSISTIESPDTPLHQQTSRLVRIFSIVGLALSIAVLVLFGLTRGNWLAGLLAGITLAMSMLPQEFPLILTVFMAMGAWRLSQQRVLARRPATIEALGSATVLCTDKTGTLTINQMSIGTLSLFEGSGFVDWDSNSASDVWPIKFTSLLQIGVLACERAPIDAMDKAFHALAKKRISAFKAHIDGALVHEYGLSPQLLAMTHVWQLPSQTTYTVACKGAVEAVVQLCRLSESDALAIQSKATLLANQGLRVLAVARAQFNGKQWPDTPNGFVFECLGLVGLLDPLRPTVKEAVAQCISAGVRIIMITGDHPSTALAIARSAGISNNGEVLTGAQLVELNDKELQSRIRSTNLFARVLPEQKLRIVNALKADGQVVAMTGDGVNDAPSLKAAHIGVAMGASGTDVARQAASLVLLDDDFGSIVGAIRLGRRIYDNLIKAMAFVLAVHVPIAGLSLLPLLFGLPMIFSPVHIAFLELLIDPVCSIAFEAEKEEGDVMKRPPRDSSTPLFSMGLLLTSLFKGALILVAIALFYVYLLSHSVIETQARAAAFIALVLSNFALILSSRSRFGALRVVLALNNRTLWLTLGATSVILLAVVSLPSLQVLFHFSSVSTTYAVAAACIGIAVFVTLQLFQRLLTSANYPRFSI